MIELRTLGSVDLRPQDGQALELVLSQSKRLALLAYLAVASPHGFHRRDKLVGLFWPELDQHHARHALNQALYALRTALGEEVLQSRGDEEVGLDKEAFWCDAAAFEESIDAEQPEKALELYRGDFLEGFFISGVPEFEKWLDNERSDLRRRAGEAAWSLAERDESLGDAGRAADWARRAASYSLEDETTIRRLVSLLDRIGDRAAAIRAYDAFSTRLERELGLEPSPETKQLIEEVRARSELQERRGELATEMEEESAEAARLAVGPASELKRTEHVARAREGRAVSQPFKWPWPRSARARRATPIALMLFAGLGLAGTAIVVFRSAGVEPTAAYAVDNPRQSFVILPFGVTADDPELYWLAEGAPNMLTIDLAGWGEIRVVGRRHVAALAASRSISLAGATLDDALAIAREARVGTLVLGDVIGQAGTVEIIVRLYDVASGEELREAEQVTGSVGEDLRPLFDQIASGILDLSGAPDLGPDVRAATTTSIDAYREYLQGLDHMYRWNLDEAIGRFESAVRLDSSFALAYHQLAVSRTWHPESAPGYFSDVDEPADVSALTEAAVRHGHRLPWRQRSHVLAFKALADRAYTLARQLYSELIGADSTDAEAWFHLADIEWHDESVVRDPSGRFVPVADLNIALHGFERAVALDPRFHLGYGHLFDLLEYLYQGRAYDYFLADEEDVAEGEDRRVFLYPAWRDSAFWVLVDPENVEEILDRWASDSITSILQDRAMQLARRWSNAAPDEGRPHFVLRDLYVEAGDYESALEAQRAFLGLEGDTSYVDRLFLGALYLANGLYDSAVIQTEAGLEGDSHWLPESIAIGVFVAQGRPSRAVAVGIPDPYPSQFSDWFTNTPAGPINWGDTKALLAEIEILGSAGANRPELASALDRLRAQWVSSYTAEQLKYLHCVHQATVGPALILLGKNAIRDWIAPLAEPLPDMCQRYFFFEVWEALAQAEADSLEAARASLDVAIARMKDRSFPPWSPYFEHYLVAEVARRLGRHSLAVDLYARLQRSPGWKLYSLTNTPGFRWGLVSLSYLKRAQSHEALGETDNAITFYQRFLSAWNGAEADLQHYADEAREGLERLGSARR